MVTENKDDAVPPVNSEAFVETYNEMADTLKRISEAGQEQATVTDIVGKYAVLSSGILALNKDYTKGQNVVVYPRTGQVRETIDYVQYIGELFVIDGVKALWAEVNIKGDRKIISKGRFNNLKEGDIVLLDRNHTVVQDIIEAAKVAPKVENPVTWDHVGGNEEAKQLLIEAIELPHTHPKLFAYYTQTNTNGILLQGPPGCGKTLLGKAAATSIGSTGGFIPIKGPEVLNEYIGVTERTIRAAFARAKAFKEASGRPAVIFIDEAESLLTARGTQNNYMGQTVVPTFLAEMDGIDQKAAVVILSTNRPDMLDPAIKREGRIDYKVEVKRPTEHEGRQIMAIHMAGKPVGKRYDTQKLIEKSTNELYQHALPFSGALIEGTVAKAVTHAIRRDIAVGASKGSGLTPEDFTWAVQQIVKQENKHAA